MILVYLTLAKNRHRRTNNPFKTPHAGQAMEPEGNFYKPDDVHISPLPMFHIYPFLMALSLLPMLGQKYVSMSKFDLVCLPACLLRLAGSSAKYTAFQ